MQLNDARDFIVNLTDSFTDEELIAKYKNMILLSKKAYQPISKSETEEKIKSLYGPLAEMFFKLSPEDKAHQAKHGAIGMF